MVTRPILLAVICLGFFLIFQALMPKAMAFGSNVRDRYMMEDQRTHRRKNYMVQKARANDMGALEGFTYDTESFDPDKNPDELSAFMVDYANMIRNDVILLDKSVETRTRKRGNIKVKKYNNQAISDPPCSCKYDEDTVDVGENVYPRYVDIRNCSRIQQRGCLPPYTCKESLYNFPILRKKGITSKSLNLPVGSEESASEELPMELKFRWYADKLLISVGCVCTRDYFARNDGVL